MPCSRGVRLFVLGRVNKAGKTHKKRVLLLSCWWQGGRQQARCVVAGVEMGPGWSLVLAGRREE